MDDDPWAVEWSVDPAVPTVEYTDRPTLVLLTPSGPRIGVPVFGFARALHPDGIEWVT